MKKIIHNLLAKASYLFSSDTGKVFIGVTVWQVLMTFIGTLYDTTLSNIFQNPASPDQGHTLLSHTMYWDGGWYESILNGAYSDPSSAASVFYPVFPFCVWLIHTLSFGLIGDPGTGFIVNLLSLFFAVLALVKIADHFVDKKYRWWIPILFLTSPAAIFLHFFYTEAIFCALAFWSYLFALRRQWWQMATFLALTAATRLPGILFVGLCALEFFRSYNWRPRQILNRHFLWFLITPLGLTLYGLYLYIVRGDFLGMIHGYKLTDDWSYHVFHLNIFDTYYIGIYQLLDVFKSPIPFDEGQSVNFFIPILSLIILTGASIYSLLRIRSKQIGIPLGIFGIVSVVFFSLNSDFVSIHRYILPTLVVYIATAHLASRRKWLHYLFYGAVYAGILIQAYLYILYVNGYFAG